nr:DMT family transporter [Pseudenhygromyxa sp. WMMC2535]
MLLATCCFIAMASFVKLLREDGLSTTQVMFWRMAPALPLVWLEMRRRGQRLRPTAAGPILWRSLFGIGAMACYFYALRALSMVENAVLSLLQPVFVAVLAPLVLDERLRRSAIFALGLGVLGSLVALRPDQALSRDVPLLPMLVGVGAALCSACAHMMVRKASATDSAERVVFWFTAVCTFGVLALGLARGEFFGLPEGLALLPAIGKIAGTALFGLSGQVLMTRAYGRAAAPMIAMVAYAAIPISVVADLVTWGVHPGPDAILGSLMMVGAGLILARGR